MYTVSGLRPTIISRAAVGVVRIAPVSLNIQTSMIKVLTFIIGLLIISIKQSMSQYIPSIFQMLL